MAASTTYRFARHVVIRSIGVAFIVAAVLLVIVSFITALGAPSPLLYGALIGLPAAVLIYAAVLARVPVLSLTEQGYAVRLVRSSGVRSGRWDEVREASTAQSEGVHWLVLHRKDGASTAIPASILSGSRDALGLDVQQRLEADSAGAVGN